MVKSAIDLCSQALVRLGAEPISSFEEGTAEADVADALYPGVRDATLSAHPWSFATGQAQLARLAAVPIADFAHAYQLPNDLLRVISAGEGGRGRGIVYRIHEGRLHTDAEAVTLTYVFRADESAWPPFFGFVVVQKLIEAFAVPLTDSTTAAEAAARAAEVALRQAKSLDSQQATPQAVSDFTLIDCRG
jgi:hypothetical protein